MKKLQNIGRFLITTVDILTGSSRVKLVQVRNFIPAVPVLGLYDGLEHRGRVQSANVVWHCVRERLAVARFQYDVVPFAGALVRIVHLVNKNLSDMKNIILKITAQIVCNFERITEIPSYYAPGNSKKLINW